jgi:hypothetical protein
LSADFQALFTGFEFSVPEEHEQDENGNGGESTEPFPPYVEDLERLEDYIRETERENAIRFLNNADASRASNFQRGAFSHGRIIGAIRSTCSTSLPSLGRRVKDHNDNTRPSTL